jgi:hypothetical protein
MDKEAYSRICKLVGGRKRLAELTGTNCTTIWRKIKGSSEITEKGRDKLRTANLSLIAELKKAFPRAANETPDGILPLNGRRSALGGL